MKKDVKVIKGDTTLKRTASGCVERSIKRVAAYCRVSTDTEDQINSYKLPLVLLSVQHSLMQFNKTRRSDNRNTG